MHIDFALEREAFTRHLKARGKSPFTIQTYLKAVDQLAALVGNEADITKTTIENFLIHGRERGLSVVTLAQRFRSLQQFFKYVAREMDTTSPMEGMQAPTIEVTPPPVLKLDDLERLFATASGRSFDDRRDLAILSLFADTGIRRGEMANITTDDFDIGEQVVIVTGKTGTRGVPYGTVTATRIDRYLRVRRDHPAADERWMWLGRKGRLTVYGIEGVVQSRGKQAGLDINPHLFRHTFAHLWLDEGGNEGDLQRLAGWKSPAMLQRYGASAASARARRAYLAGRSPVDKMKRPVGASASSK